MSDRLDRVEARLRQVEEGLACALRRLDAIERPPETPAPQAFAPAPATTNVPRGIVAVDSSSLVALVGRTFIVLGGAYLLRAVTDTGRVGLRGGVTLGFIYAIAWFAIADRTNIRRRASALFHGVAGALIGLPLLWEAAARFHVLTARSSAVALAIWTATALVVAWHRRLAVLAAVGVAGAIGTSFVLSVATGAFAPFALFLVVLTFGVWALCDADGWRWLRWPVAAAADLVAVAVIVRASAVTPVEPAIPAVVVLFVLTIGSLMLFAWPPLARRQPIGVFEMTQTACVIAIGVAGALALQAKVDLSVWPAIAWLGSGVMAYVATPAAARVRGAVGYYFAMVGFSLTVAGAWQVIPSAWLDGCLAAAALACLWIGVRVVHPVLAVQGAGLALAACVHAGFVGYASAVWALHSTRPGASAAWLAAVVAAAGVVPIWSSRGALNTAARAWLRLLFVAGSVTLVASFAEARLSAWSANVGLLAAGTTIVLSAAVIGLALATRGERVREFGWLVYLLLAAGALKLFLIDIAVSGATAMFLSFAAYGLALTLSATMTTRARKSAVGD